MTTAPKTVTAEQETLIRDNMPLVGHMVREMLFKVPPHVHRDDLASAGYAALVTAAQAFDPGRGVPFGRAGYLRRAMAAGASGFIVKDTPARQLADAVRRVHAGLRVVDPALAAQSLAHGDSPLTERETDVLRSARDGGTVADIAGDLHLSEGTVRNHLSAAIGKTGARTRAEAVRLTVDNGWLLA